jgi:response regulator RpfG family c-di-GMP phosphodiesterase
MNRLLERHVVVLVDDEPKVLASLRRALRGEPYFVLTTGDPAQALRWIASRDVSVVVSDQRMPSMDGMELLRRVRERSPATARVILSAYTGETARSPGLRGDVDTLVSKPWDERMLKRVLREFLSEREWCDAHILS